MIEFEIPGKGHFQLKHLVCDVNGTLAVDGILPEELPQALEALRGQLTIHLLTADTHGKQAAIDHQLNLQAVRIQRGREAEQKAAFVRQLGAAQVAAIGQGANDAQMLSVAAIGIGILSQEGIAKQTLLAADILVPDIFAALGLLQNPLRITATLRA